MLSLYLSANLLLLISYLAFAAMARVPAGPRPLLRGAQLAILLSLLAPAALSVLPDRSLPALPGFHDPAPEGLHHPGTSPPARAGSRLLPITRTITWAREAPYRPSFSWMLLVWLAVLSAGTIRLLRHARALRRLLRSATRLRELRRTRVLVSDTISVPFSARGPRYRYVVLPLALLERPRDLRLALRHELQHHRQGDVPWAIALEALACLCFLNPAAHAWKRRLNELQELACDEALMGRQPASKREYASCLVRVAETALAGRAFAGTTQMLAHGKDPFLKRRLEMLLRKKMPLRWMGPALGTAGVLVTLASAIGLDRAARAAAESSPNPGSVVVNENVQKITERILRDAIDVEEASEGFAIVTEPSTGRVLAVANVDTTGKKQGYWALAQRMEPASLAKTLVAAEAIERGKTTPQEKHYCEKGVYRYGGRDFHDWRTQGFQHLTTAQTIAKSSDICTVKIAEKIGLEGVHQLLEKFGFGPGGTASAFAGAASGQLPPRGGPLDRFFVPYVAYGQGFRSTPLELMQAYAAIANGGELLMPLPATATAADRKVVRTVMSGETARQMREILEGVVHEGTARLRARSYLYSTAGKTASAFSPDDSWLETSRGTRKSNLAGFLGFAPARQPKVEVLVAIRNPKVSIDRDSGAHGAEHAAPVFRQIAEAVLQELKVAPDAL